MRMRDAGATDKVALTSRAIRPTISAPCHGQEPPKDGLDVRRGRQRAWGSGRRRSTGPNRSSFSPPPESRSE